MHLMYKKVTQIYSLSKSVTKFPLSMASTLELLITAHNVIGFPLWPSKIHTKYKIQLFCLLHATTIHFKMDQP